MAEKLLKKDFLLEEGGRVKNYGFAKNMVLTFNRDCCKNLKRVKEQDMFFVSNARFGLCLSISDIGGQGVISACLVDFIRNKQFFKISKAKKDKNKLILVTNPYKGVSEFKTKDAKFRFEYGDKEIHLIGEFAGFFDQATHKDLFFDFVVQGQKKESFMESACFKNPFEYCLMNTVCGLSASGRFSFDGNEFGLFESENYVTYSFCRGLLPHKTSWRSACFQMKTEEGKPFAVKLSMGPGNNEVDDKSMIFIDGNVEVVDEVKIYIQKKGYGKDFMGIWTFYSNDGKVELTFEPQIENKHTAAGCCYLHRHHQVFGQFSGKITLDNKEVVKIQNVNGYAEASYNLW